MQENLELAQFTPPLGHLDPYNVDMPNIAIHDADEEPGVSTEPMVIVNNVFRNMLADDTEDNDGISQLLRNVETGCLSER